MKKVLLFLFVLAFPFSTFTYSQTYTIDPSHTAVFMKVQRFGVVNVVGRFGDVQGTITFDPVDASAMDIKVKVGVDSYSANNEGGEESAKSRAFLDAANFPEITFVLKDAVDEDGTFSLTGDLTLHGVTKEVEFSAEIIGPKTDLPTRKQSIALSGTLYIDRLDYGVGPTMVLPDGTEVISNRVEISMDVLGIAE